MSDNNTKAEQQTDNQTSQKPKKEQVGNFILGIAFVFTIIRR